MNALPPVLRAYVGCAVDWSGYGPPLAEVLPRLGEVDEGWPTVITRS